MVSRVNFGWGRENSNSTVALQHEIHTSLLLPNPKAKSVICSNMM